MNSVIEKEKSWNESSILDPSEKQYYKVLSFWSRIKHQLKGSTRIMKENHFRIIKPNNPPYPRRLINISNKVDNTKYKWYSFVLLFLYFEFSQFSNLNYLLLCVSQFFPALKVGKLIRILDFLCDTTSNHFNTQILRRNRATL